MVNLQRDVIDVETGVERCRERPAYTMTVVVVALDEHVR